MREKREQELHIVFLQFHQSVELTYLKKEPFILILLQVYYTTFSLQITWHITFSFFLYPVHRRRLLNRKGHTVT